MSGKKADKTDFRTAFLLIREFPGRFVLVWQVDESSGGLLPFDSREHPYDEGPVHPNAKLQLWLTRRNGRMQIIFPNLSLPDEADFRHFQMLVQ